MIAMMQAAGTRKFMLLAGAFALVLSVMGCATPQGSPLSSHGVARVRTFNPMAGGGG
jgi:hypothetical protein